MEKEFELQPKTTVVIRVSENNRIDGAESLWRQLRRGAGAEVDLEYATVTLQDQPRTRALVQRMEVVLHPRNLVVRHRPILEVNQRGHGMGNVAIWIQLNTASQNRARTTAHEPQDEVEVMDCGVEDAQLPRWVRECVRRGARTLNGTDASNPSLGYGPTGLHVVHIEALA